MTDRTMLLELDEDDFRSIQEAIACRQLYRVMPDGGGNIQGRIVAEICRGFLELKDVLGEDSSESWKNT